MLESAEDGSDRDFAAPELRPPSRRLQTDAAMWAVVARHRVNK